MTSPRQSVDVRSSIVNTFRRDLVGPGPQDADLARERLNENPSRWYLTGFLAPADDPLAQKGARGAEDDPSTQEEMETDVEEPDDTGAGGAAGDTEPPEAPTTKRRFLPSSIGLTVLLPPEVKEIEARICWGDYQTEPPLPEIILLPDEADDKDEDGKPKKKRPLVDWVRTPRQESVRVVVPEGRGDQIVVPESAAPQRSGGGLVLETHARLFTYPTPNGNEQVRALTVFLVNRRSAVHRFYADVSFVFQARLELACTQGFRPRRDLSGYNSGDFDLRVADLHYRDVCEWAVGRNAAAAWDAEEERAERVTRVWTDPLPQAEVERVAPNEDVDLKSRVVFGMEPLAECASGDGTRLNDALSALPALYAAWIDAERKKIGGLAARRRETAERLIADMEAARQRILDGIEILSRNEIARNAFRFMNLAVARPRGAAMRAPLAIQPHSRHPNGGLSSSPSSCSISPASPIASMPIARSPTCCSSRPAAARPRPISALRRS